MGSFYFQHRGSVVKIELTNFMVYAHVEFKPGPGINILFGPNGTGKSSIMCGVIIGLGGKPKTIGRTALLKDYINRKKGKKAKIVIELYNPNGENYVVQREFNVMNKNTWHLNGKLVSHKEIDDLKAKLNIKVENLCQFLPQDKVSDFTKMNAQELLENTVKTVGSYNMIEWHSKLVDLRKNKEEVQKLIMDKTNEIERARHTLANLENVVKLVRERNKNLELLELMNQKKEWTVYTERAEEVKEISSEREKLAVIKSSIEKELKPFQMEVKKAENSVRCVEQELIRRMENNVSYLNKIHKRKDEMNNLEDSISRILREEKSALEDIKVKEQEVSKLKKFISLFESTTVDPAKEKELELKSQNLKAKLSSLGAEEHQLFIADDNAKYEIRAQESICKRTEEKINSANNLAAEKYNNFKRFNPEAYEMMMWLEDNRDKFKGHVYNPMQLEINVKAEFAKYVENLIPQRDLSAFLCEYNEDVSTLLHYGRVVKKLKINAISAENCASQNYKSAVNISDIRSFGFQCYVSENIEGPRPILNYLHKIYNIHNIPIGTAATESVIDSIPMNFSSFFTANNHYSIRTSKYTRAKLSTMTSLREDVRFLINTPDMSLVQELKDKNQVEHQKLNDLREKLKAIHIKSEIMGKTSEKLKTERKEVQTKLEEIRSLRTNLVMKKEELRVLTESIVDPEVCRNRAKQKILATIMQMGDLQKVIYSDIAEYHDNLNKCKLLKLKKLYGEKLVKIKQSQLADHTTGYEEAKRDLEIKESELAEAKREKKRAWDVARRTTAGLTPNDSSFKEKFFNKFKDFPNTVEELEESIVTIKGHLACLEGEGSKNSLEEYERQSRLVKSLQSDLESPELSLRSLTENIEQIRTKWMEGVTNLIAQIDEKFSLFFSVMKCVGEVSLYKPQIEDNYKDYGISIKVKFRGDERLVALGRSQQSGGERAVSIAVYMLALQHLTTVPFRCVDEINQGMDERNERLVYKLLMETTETASATQCFLLTPKLLKDMNYSNLVTICSVNNGQVAVIKRSIYINMKSDKPRHLRKSLKRKRKNSENNGTKKI